jgi:hypothetical protein
VCRTVRCRDPPARSSQLAKNILGAEAFMYQLSENAKSSKLRRTISLSLSPRSSNFHICPPGRRRPAGSSLADLRPASFFCTVIVGFLPSAQVENAWLAYWLSPSSLLLPDQTSSPHQTACLRSPPAPMQRLVGSQTRDEKLRSSGKTCCPGSETRRFLRCNRPSRQQS